MLPGRSDEGSFARPCDDIFVGREREMEELCSALEAALAGHGRLVLVVGEPGIGKTRTTQELVTCARRRGARTLIGRCHESTGAPPFWPWVQIVRAYLADCDAESLSRDMGAGAAEIARVMTEVRERLPDLPTAPPLEPHHERFRFFDSFTTFISNAARARPLVLVLDDLPAADAPSLLLLQFVARDLEGVPLLIIGTYRDVELGGQHPLADTLGELVRAPASRTLALSGLTQPDVTRFIELAMDEPPAEAVATAVYQKTEGNPFFVTEVVRMLTTEGRTAALANPQTAIGLPRRVREAIVHRLQTLSEDCRRLLTIAAVIGRDFSAQVLAASAGRSDSTERGVAERLDEAVSARLVATVPSAVGLYTFSHALIRDTLYDVLTAAQRSRMHGLVGQALEAIHGSEAEPPLAQLAFHFFHAAPGGAGGKAIAYARRAGDRAMRLLAYEEAVAHYERSLQVMELRRPGDAERCALLLALGDALWQAGESQRARETFVHAAQIARALGAAGLLAQAALGLGNVRAETGVIDQVLVGLLDEALTALGAGDSALRARVMARLAMALYFSPSSEEHRNALSVQALAMAQRVGEPGTLAFALLARHFVLWGLGGVEERLTLATEVVRLAEEAGDAGVVLEGQAWRILALFELGDIDAVDREIERYARQSVRLRTPRNRWYLQLVRSARAFLAGQFDEGERLATEAAGVRGEGGELANAFMFFGAQLFTLRREQGRFGELEPALTGFAEQFATLPIWRCSLAVFHAEHGNHGAARRELEHLAEREFTALPQDANRPPAFALLAEACSMLGDAPRAARLYQLLLPYAGLNIVVATAAICYGPAARYLGLLAATLAHWDDAARHFTAALAMSRRMGAQPWTAHTQHDYAQMLLARGGSDAAQRAGELLEDALVTARDLGMKSLAEKIETLKAHIAPTLASGSAVRLQELRGDLEGARAGEASASVFRLEGDYWTVWYQGTVLRLKDSTGARYLSCLLRHPHKDVHVFDLVDLIANRAAHSTGARAAAVLAETGMHVTRAGDAATVFDSKARAAYKRRLADLRSELEEAKDFNDRGRVERLQAEVAFLSRELAAGFGLNRQHPRASSSVDQARVNVTRAIRRVTQKLLSLHRPLGIHLTNTVRTGLFCSYRPDPRLPISWLN